MPIGRVGANVNVSPIIRSSLTREDTVTLPDSSQKADSSTQPLFPAEDGARLFMANSPLDFEFAQPLWLVKTILLRLPCVNMLGSSSCTSCVLPTDFLRLRVIRDIMATWGRESGSSWRVLQETGELTVRLAVKRSNYIKLVEISKRWQQAFRLTVIQVCGIHV